MFKKFCPFLSLLCSACMVLMVGCGKKQNEKDGDTKPPRYENPQISDIEVELQKQELFCGSDRACPSYLTKVAVLTKNKLKFCTGFLTESNMVATASSCLPERLRGKDLPCDKDVFFFFAQSNQKPLRVACNRVLDATSVDAKEAFLWRSNVTYLELKSEVRRRSVNISRNGMADMERFNVWSIDQIDDHQGIIRKSEECLSVYNSYFNPFASNQSSPVMTLAACEFSEGNSGAPILDYRGRVRGIISRPVAQADINEVLAMRILEKPLKSLIHVSNYACAPTIPEQEVLNENECSKKLEINLYDTARKEMISESILFRSTLQKIEHAANETNRYLRLAVKTVEEDDLHKVEIFPKCYKNVAKWIGEFRNTKDFDFDVYLPDLKLKKAMNEFGKIFAQEIGKDEVMTNFAFSPRFLRNTRKSHLYMRPKGRSSIPFLNLSENCESLF